MISKLHPNLAFKGYVPVKFFAKDEKTGNNYRVINHENLRKCQGFVVRNLNRTAKGDKNDEFVKFYRQYDPDYRNVPAVTSFYNDPDVYMITGRDVDVSKQLAKPVGIAKGKSMNILGHAKSFEAKSASRKYAENMKTFLKRACRRLKDSQDRNLTLHVYFNPVFSKTETLKNFEFDHAEFVTEE